MKIEIYKQNPKGHFKEWTSKVFYKNPGAGKPFARAIGKSRDLVHAYCDPDDANNLHGYNLPILIDETGDITILKEIARMFGFALVHLNGDPASMLRALAEEMEAGKK